MKERSNAEWLADLQAEEEKQQAALEDLRTLLQCRLESLFAREIPASRLEAIIAETLAAVSKQQPKFEGQSAFVTWVFKIALRQILLEIRKQHFPGELPARTPPPTPVFFYLLLFFSPFFRRLHTIFREELTEKQRIAIRAMVMCQMPKEEVARYLGMERAAYFAMMHDARLRLKRRFEREKSFSKRLQNNVQSFF